MNLEIKLPGEIILKAFSNNFTVKQFITVGQSSKTFFFESLEVQIEYISSTTDTYRATIK